MKARELPQHAWFYWLNDWRVFERLPGPIKLFEGVECVVAHPLQPTPNTRGGFIPADDEVKLRCGEKVLRIS